MMVFGAGATLGLATAFFAYLSRTFRMERPPDASWRMPLRWLAVGAAMLGAACFLIGLNMARIAVHQIEVTAVTPSGGSAQPNPSSPVTTKP